ncbi:unnamed protein product [Gongylonema pulchrum]|uniref:TPX2 domain-containing protein n=1 Tax=Gongylonema pulchrum TaxID=637853 RepID=A0A183DEC2_9BILA|nr:unnamed protein product [Gongylonema pulchrum]
MDDRDRGQASTAAAAAATTAGAGAVAAKMKFSKRQVRPSESASIAAPPEAKIFRRALGKPASMPIQPSAIFVDKKRRERSASKEARTKELAALASQAATLNIASSSDSMKKWTALDDVALITAVAWVNVLPVFTCPHQFL